jgi:hypothetical protein
VAKDPPAGPRTDPVLERRRHIARLVQAGKRVGTAAFAAAVLLFILGMTTGFTTTQTTAIVVCLLLGSAVLAPAIVFGYAVRAAEREDREQGRLP